MPTSVKAIKRILFRVIARTAIAIYSRVPIFGYLRASLAVLRKDDLILVIDRNDGRGLSFPGGISHPGETAEQSLRREVREETGMHVKDTHVLFEYRTSVDVPCDVTVFAAQAHGELAESWEGSPRWLPLTEIRTRILASQMEVINRISQGNPDKSAPAV